MQKIIQYFSAKNWHPKICMVTNGAQIVNKNDTTINLNASTITGVLRTIENEHNEFSFLHIDISNAIHEEELKQIPVLIFTDKQYKEIAVRNKLVFANSITSIKSTKITKTIKQDTTYIVVGGTSGLGLETVKWLAAKHAKHIAIISRNGASDAAKEIYNQLTQTQIVEYFADVSDAEQLEIEIDRIKNELPKVVGIIFAAGILDDGAFDNLSKQQFQNVIQLKANGAWNLHQLFHNNELDFFALYSSAAGIVGSAGQSNYAAANTFLDQLANYRNAKGQTAVAIDFGTIAEVGLSARQENRGERLIEQGVLPIYPIDLPLYFDTLILSDAAQIMALQIDFEKWASFNSSIKSTYFYKNVVQQKTENSIIANKQQNEFPNLVAHLNHIKQSIKNYISIVTKISINKIKEDDTFKSIGVDSLLALQIKNKLQEEFLLQLNVSVIWSYPTTNKLADFMAKELKLTEKYATKNEDNNTVLQPLKNDIESEVENLSLEELMKELASKVD